MLAKLIAQEGPLLGTTLLLVDSQEEWMIGRDPDSCDLIIEDPRVSRQHVRCQSTPDGILLENLSATNPIKVNGVPLKEPYLVKDGDLVKIGTSIYRFAQEEAATDPEVLAIQEEPHGGDSYETVFERADDEPTDNVDLQERGRWLLKVVSGPQSGAEFSLQPQKQYTIGTDIGNCDIVFHDLSISRQHARLTLQNNGTSRVEDLGSRNGILIDGNLISQESTLDSGHVLTLGTTSFVIIDREQASQTIISPPLIPPAPIPTKEEDRQQQQAAASAAFPSQSFEDDPLTEPFRPLPPTLVIENKALPLQTILVMFLVGIFSLVCFGTWSLLTPPKPHILPQKDYQIQIGEACREFPAVAYTFNNNTGRLFLLGHVLTQLEKSQLMYNLKALTFIKSIDDNVIIDELIWQGMNTVLAKNPAWRGIAMHAPLPGRFVITGYLQTRDQAAQLNDYLLLNFNYLDRLDNQIAIEQDLIEQVQSDLLSNNLLGVSPSLSNGELVLTGFIPTNSGTTFDTLVQSWQALHGIRIVKTFVVKLTAEDTYRDISSNYLVTGSSKQGDEVINVIINGRILSVGDALDGMKITDLDGDTVYLEKGGLKYKITYNL